MYVGTARKILNQKTNLNSLQISNILGDRISISKDLIDEIIRIKPAPDPTTWGDVLLAVSDICKTVGVNERVKDITLIGPKIEEVIKLDRT